MELVHCKKAKSEQNLWRERQNHKNNERMKASGRGMEAGTSLLSVPNEEKRAGIIIKKPH